MLNILQSIVGLPNTKTGNGIDCVQQSLKTLTNKDFIYSPILCDNDSHWCVAIISKNEIRIFDSTLQTKQANNKLMIGDSEQTITYLNEYKSLNKEFIVQHKDGQICGLCCAEFIIQASQRNNLRHLNDNIEIICDNVAVRVAEVITREKIRGQLTDYYCDKIINEGLTIQELKKEQKPIIGKNTRKLTEERSNSASRFPSP